MNADGTGVTQLTFPGANMDEGFEPSFSPDGNLIVFRRDDGATGFDEILCHEPERERPAGDHDRLGDDQ